jgi:hypothetical protein
MKNSRLEELTKKLLDSLEWKGFAHLDWIFSKKTNDYVLTDFNPRLPGFSNFLTKSGFEIGYFYYADILDLPIKFSTKKSIYFECFRFPGDISNCIRGLLTGKISTIKVILSYANIANPKYKKIFDVFIYEDPIFTILYWSRICAKFLRRISYIVYEEISRILKNNQLF